MSNMDLPFKKSGIILRCLFVGISMFSGIVSCSRFVVYPGELTATAMAKLEPVDFIETPSPVEPPSTPEIINPIGYKTPEPVNTSTPTRIQTTPELKLTLPPPILYYTQSGDSLSAVASHFNVNTDEISSPDPIDPISFLNPKHLLIIPNRIFGPSPQESILPDSEVVYSPSAKDLNIEAFVKNAGGYLTTYREYLPEGWETGSQIIRRVSIENSLNPRLLLSILEYESHWVYGKPTNLAQEDYPMGWKLVEKKGLYRQLKWAALQLSLGYYNWRSGDLPELTFIDLTRMRVNPQLNAGSVALQFYFSKIYRQQEWSGALYSKESLPALHEKMFGNFWTRSQTIEPLFPDNFNQPVLELPFLPGKTWSLTAGPHMVWFLEGGPLAAIDFAPPSDNHGCTPSDEPLTAPAPGVIVRSENGIVILDLDGDGFEQTGWDLFFLHVANKGRVPKGTLVNKDDILGYPSCEGGTATGTHVHMARKFNGEWILADGPAPLVLSGWRAVRGEKPYQGKLIKDGKTIVANTSIEANSLITREK